MFADLPGGPPVTDRPIKKSKFQRQKVSDEGLDGGEVLDSK